MKVTKMNKLNTPHWKDQRADANLAELTISKGD